MSAPFSGHGHTAKPVLVKARIVASVGTNFGVCRSGLTWIMREFHWLMGVLSLLGSMVGPLFNVGFGAAMIPSAIATVEDCW